ncbi:DNA-3-methyladenine glycosylase family protein [Candidatus Neomarinimicrobiota bacterium]
MSLDLDLEAFYQFAATIPQLPDFDARQRGLRPIIKDTLLEALILAVMDQQVNVAFAAKLKGRFLERYGRCYELDGIELRLFPEPEQLAQLEADELKTIQLTGNRSSSIIGLAQLYLDGKNWPNTIGASAEIVRELCALKGIGPWTAEYSVLVGQGLMDTLPAADIALMRSVEKLYGLSTRPTEKEVRELAQYWSPWKGLVTLYLWHREEMEVLGI